MSAEIIIQHSDFSVAAEHKALMKDAPKMGAVVTFTGLVREFDDGRGRGLFLEHYPAMTEKVLKDISAQAATRWPIINSRIIHRIGELTLGEQIVFVGVNSAHRDAAFDACRFIMDFLKTDAPFWKKALTTHNDYWIDAKDSDQQAKNTWDNHKD